MSQDNATTSATPSMFAAHNKPTATSSLSSAVYGDADLATAKTFGRVAEDGTVFVNDDGTEREIGQYASAKADEALDLYARRYLDLKAKISHARARFESLSIKPREIDETLASLKEEVKLPSMVGDLNAVRKAVEELGELGESVKDKLAKAHEEAIKAAVSKRTAIVEEAEALAGQLGESTNWRNTSDKFKQLFNQWQDAQKHGTRIQKDVADELWGRFSKARATFNEAHRAWISARDEARNAARSAKQNIISRAQELKDSTEWAETSRKFTALMNEWKKAGNVGRNEDDALWKQFRAAADVFFNARQADRDRMNDSEKENLSKKEELLTKAEALVPVADAKAAKAARVALSAIQDEWDAIGRVPRADVSRIEARMDAVEKQIKEVEEAEWSRTDPEANARKSSFTQQLEQQLAELDSKIAAEADAAKKAALQAERDAKAQWLSVVK
ncbi:DUF349 domain-containing protein [Alloscardovia theropitheci]|uniref:DUF349 domain-containing protein n=1 Tax=Alloscardovia theropitheci TaxID=2496842 RepID=A0A4R0QTZ8_9BIFI|nr:DUF349 domain-containing protein [Alloscardovia theropitheci]TCD54825.1 DUF349 domain-containing protein [Alloscardovia theropitheci]